MFKYIKQLFCNHKYKINLNSKPEYLSVGDEYADRKTKKYHWCCVKCGKQFDVLKSWKVDDIEKELF